MKFAGFGGNKCFYLFSQTSTVTSKTNIPSYMRLPLVFLATLPSVDYLLVLVPSDMY